MRIFAKKSSVIISEHLGSSERGEGERRKKTTTTTKMATIMALQSSMAGLSISNSISNSFFGLRLSPFLPSSPSSVSFSLSPSPSPLLRMVPILSSGAMGMARFVVLSGFCHRGSLVLPLSWVKPRAFRLGSWVFAPHFDEKCVHGRIKLLPFAILIGLY